MNFWLVVDQSNSRCKFISQWRKQWHWFKEKSSNWTELPDFWGEWRKPFLNFLFCSSLLSRGSCEVALHTFSSAGINWIKTYFINHSPFFFWPPNKATLTESCVSQTFLPQLLWLLSMGFCISAVPGTASARGRGRVAKKAKYAATCPQGTSLVHTLVQRPGCIGGWQTCGVFCLPCYPFIGLLCASPTVLAQGSPAVQATTGFAILRMKSWEEEGKQQS